MEGEETELVQGSKRQDSETEMSSWVSPGSFTLWGKDKSPGTRVGTLWPNGTTQSPSWGAEYTDVGLQMRRSLWSLPDLCTLPDSPHSVTWGEGSR